MNDGEGEERMFKTSAQHYWSGLKREYDYVFNAANMGKGSDMKLILPQTK